MTDEFEQRPGEPTTEWARRIMEAAPRGPSGERLRPLLVPDVARMRIETVPGEAATHIRTVTPWKVVFQDEDGLGEYVRHRVATSAPVDDVPMHREPWTSPDLPSLLRFRCDCQTVWTRDATHPNCPACGKAFPRHALPATTWCEGARHVLMVDRRDCMCGHVFRAYAASGVVGD